MKKLFLILFLPVICFGQVIQWPETHNATTDAWEVIQILRYKTNNYNN